jgi:hypothetical protein
MRHLCILQFVFVISGLINNAVGQKVPVLQLSSALEKPVPITTSDFIESITYIPLATSPDYLVDANPKVYVTKDFILIITLEKCQLFDRRNGEFIREIGRKGRGPGEYYTTSGFFNESTRSYYFVGSKGYLIKYTLDGIFRGSMKIPEYNDGFEIISFPDIYSYINDTLLVCNFVPGTGTENKILMTFTEKGKVIKIFPNFNILEKKNNLIISIGDSKFHRFDNNLFYSNRYNDTVFRITINQMVPSFIVNAGKYRPPFESRWWTEEKRKKSDFLSQSQIFENTRFIAFNFFLNLGFNRYFALYNKQSKSLKVTRDLPGIENTTDGFLNFNTGSINGAGELSFLVQPGEILEWIEQNPEKFKSLKPELQKLKDLKLEDNPVVVIAKYKK